MWIGYSCTGEMKGIVGECSDFQGLRSTGTNEALVGQEGVRFEGLVGFWCNHSDSAALSEHEELTQCITQRLVSRSSQSPFNSSRASGLDPAEKPSHEVCISRGPEFLERVNSAQRFGFRVFESALSMPKPSLQIHHPG